MKSEQSFRKKSYQRHAEFYPSRHNSETNKVDLEKVFFDKSVDRWRHERMYQMVDPLIEADEKTIWLTVGDGRFGKDARYLLDKGAEVHASDISDSLLEISHKAGYLTQYSAENAEDLSFKDNRFDYTLCKESYHHFPRPMVALYEMLRVSRKGVFLIEPNDIYIESNCMARAFWQFKNTIKSILGKPPNKKHDFEEVGNYLFRVSKREIEKVALGLNLKYIAIRLLNDVYLPDAGKEKLGDRGPIFKKLNRLILLTNIMCRLGLMQYNMIGIAIFKEAPPEEIKNRLLIHGFEFIELPDNPFL